MKPIVQISLDVTSIDEALETAEMAVRAGVDWLEAGTPLILSQGLLCVRELRARFPEVPIVADLKTMDGGYLEAEMMAKAGANYVVVMARAHEETIKVVCKAGQDYGIGVMGDNLGCPDMVAGARMLQDLGCGYIIHHIGYDERRGIAASGKQAPTPLDQLREVVQAVDVPVQAVGGMSIEQAIERRVEAVELMAALIIEHTGLQARHGSYGAPLVVIGAPLAINPDRFERAGGNLETVLKQICEAVHAYGDIPVKCGA